MNCWMCKYFKIPTKDEPCINCRNKDKFVLWFEEETREKSKKICKKGIANYS